MLKVGISGLIWGEDINLKLSLLQPTNFAQLQILFAFISESTGKS